MKLILVESPTKARTLARFLGKDYRIEATMGHIRDLPKSALGVDINHDFTPTYVVSSDKKKRVTELKELASKADTIILASDPDREGEAIAWHVMQVISDTRNVTRLTSHVSRIVFHEITESAIKAALEHPGEIDMKLVDAQQARRILDRLVGYKLSPLLWKKLSKRWLSAGRVQSVVVRLIVEREREREKFKTEKYWTIEGKFNLSSKIIVAQLVDKNGIPYEKTKTHTLFDGKYTVTSSLIVSEQLAGEIIVDLKDPYIVSAVDKKEVKRAAPPPYTTSTLQQDAGRRLYFSAKKTMQTAQKLYEEGFITYHRTDSVNLAEKFITEVRAYIEYSFGKDYLPTIPKKYQTKSKSAQEAHEAIRPTDVNLSNLSNSSNLTNELNRDHTRLYELIWKRAVACQMKEAIFDATTIIITSANKYTFQVQGSVIKFDGYLKVAGHENGEVELPSVTVGQTVNLNEATPIEHETAPPPRYTEASLVKTLEEKDIGRPSTYAPIISTVIDRQYVKKEDLPAGRQGKKLVPTELGIAVTDFLVKYFPKLIDIPFTAGMENNLDRIASGEKTWVPVIAEFYTPFAKILDSVMATAQKVKLIEEDIHEECPECHNPLVIRTGRFGKFVACTNFPKCKYTRQLVEKIDKACPKCGSAIVVKRTRKGKTFYGCSNYPNCTFAAWRKEDIK